jgi:tetratricopeptide (TPR) repeat protein
MAASTHPPKGVETIPLIRIATFLLSSFTVFAQNSQTEFADWRVRAIHPPDLSDVERAQNACPQEADLLLARGRSIEAAHAYVDCGATTQNVGNYQAAEALYNKGIDLLKANAPHDLSLVLALDDMGWMYVTWGKDQDASRLMYEARARAQGAPLNDSRLIRHYDVQAAYFEVTGHYTEAERNWNRALEIREINYGPDSTNYDELLLHFAQGSALYGNYAVAEKMLQRYLDIEASHRLTGTILHAAAEAELAHVYMQVHKWPEARRCFDEASAIFKSQPDQSPLIHSILLSYLGDFYMATRDWKNAQEQYRAALELEQRVFGNNRAVAQTMVLLSQALQKLHRKDEAKSLIGQAKAILAIQTGPAQDQTVDVIALRRQ